MNKNNLGNDSLVRSIGAIFLGLIVLALVYNVFFSPGPMMQGYGVGMAPGGGYGAGMHHNTGYGMGLSLSGILAGILIILIKILSILLVVGLIVGMWIVVRDYMFAEGNNPFTMLTAGLTRQRMNCPKCGSAVDNKWDFCPDCGEQLTKVDKPQPTQNP